MSLVIGPFPPTTAGPGTIDCLPHWVRDAAAGSPTRPGRADRSRVLVVTDRGLRGSRVVGQVSERAGTDGCAVAVFDGVHPNPTTGDLLAGAAAARDFDADVVVAVGGGSAMDAAKGIALAASNPGRESDLAWGAVGMRSALPIVCAPTTAGSGAEVNDFAVVVDDSLRRKVYLGHPSCRAAAVILDPELTVTLPPGPTAASGIDCLTHAVESFTSVRANPWADALDLQVMALVRQWLPRVLADGEDVAARAQMQLAAHMAGQAMSTTGLGIVHAIGHPLGGRHDLPHGDALAVVLAACLRFNESVSRPRLARCAQALGVHVSGTSDRRNADAAIAAVEQLVHDVPVGGRLTDRGISRDDLATIVDDALVDPVIDNTPRPPTATDVLSILEAVL